MTKLSKAKELDINFSELVFSYLPTSLRFVVESKLIFLQIYLYYFKLNVIDFSFKLIYYYFQFTDQVLSWKQTNLRIAQWINVKVHQSKLFLDSMMFVFDNFNNLFLLNSISFFYSEKTLDLFKIFGKVCHNHK